jgi:hypothetical protein
LEENNLWNEKDRVVVSMLLKGIVVVSLLLEGIVVVSVLLMENLINKVRFWGYAIA